MMDFHRIRFEEDALSIAKYNALHRYAFDYIAAEVQKEGKKIVITHHLPSIQCNAIEFRSSMITEAFCVDYTQFIQESSIDYWIYGHSHRNLEDIRIGNTTMVTNQLGYVELGEHFRFSRDRVITI